MLVFMPNVILLGFMLNVILLGFMLNVILLGLMLNFLLLCFMLNAMLNVMASVIVFWVSDVPCTAGFHAGYHFAGCR